MATAKPKPKPKTTTTRSGTNAITGVTQTQGSRASAGIGGTGTNPATNGLGTGISLIPAALLRPTFWTRAGVFILGIALIWVGIVLAIASNKKVQALAGTVAGSALAKTPQGVAANLATGALA